MIRLVWNGLAWLLALATVYLWVSTEPSQPFVYRESFLLSLLVVLLAVRWGDGYSNVAEIHPAHTRFSETLTSVGQIFLGTGVVCAMAALFLQLILYNQPDTEQLVTGLSTLSDASGVSRFSSPLAITTELLWWLSRAFLLLTMLWPRAWYYARGGGTKHVTAEGAERAEPLAPQSSDEYVIAFNWRALLLVLFLGLAMRLLIISQLPAFCVGDLCTMALTVSSDQWGNSLSIILAQLFYGITADSLLSIHLATTTLVLGLLTGLFGLAHYLTAYITRNDTARQRFGPYAGALLGTTLIAFSGWFQTLDGFKLSALLFCFWTTLGLWGLFHAAWSHRPRWALLAGALLGFATADPWLQVALLLWLLLMALYTLFASLRTPSADDQSDRRSWRETFPPAAPLLALVGLAVTLLPTLLQPDQITQLMAFPLMTLPFDGRSWLVALFQHGELTALQWASVPPLTMVLGAATLVGIGYLLRSRPRPIAFWLLSGVVISLLLFAYTGNGNSYVEYATFVFLSVALISIVAVDRIVFLVQSTWRPLWSPSTVTALALLLMVVVMLKPLWTVVTASGDTRSTAQTAMEQQMLRQIADLLTETPDLQLFAPATVQQNPAAQLYLDTRQLAQVQPLSDLLDAYYTSDQLHPTAYLIPEGANAYLNLIGQLQPGVNFIPQTDSTNDEVLYTLGMVTVESQSARQGLMGMLWEQRADGSSTSQPLPVLGPLEVTAGMLPSLQPPYTIQWTGALRIGAPGTYRFALAREAQDAATISMQLDNRLVIDTLLGVTEQEMMLAKGIYQLTLLYRLPTAVDATGNSTDAAAEPAPFALTWRRPTGEQEVIPRELLYNGTVPNEGLTGAYYRGEIGEAQNNERIDLRKDLVVGLVDDRQESYFVEWQGQLAIPRTGEYLLAALSPPGDVIQLVLDGLPLIDTTQLPPDSATSSAGEEVDALRATMPAATSTYAEGTIYLQRGWHQISVTYQPSAETRGSNGTMQLYWQVPGSDPAPLPNRYLAPNQTALTESDRGLPQAPALSTAAGMLLNNANTGDYTGFALSYGTEFWQPQYQYPPSYLPTLPVEEVWKVGNCGSGEGALTAPRGVAISSARQQIYVADTANQRVVEYTWGGDVTQIYTHPDWQEPVAVSLIDAGFPAVLDAVTQQIYDLNPATGRVEPRPLATGFYYPRGLAVDTFGNLLVADTGGARVVRLTPGGEASYTFGGQESQFGRGQPTSVIEVNGMLWAITAEDGRLWQIDTGGNYQAITPTNTIYGPQLAALSNGTFLLSDPVQRRLLYLAATGEPLGVIALPALSQPTGIAATIADNLLQLVVVDTGNCQLSFLRTPVPSPEWGR